MNRRLILALLVAAPATAFAQAKLDRRVIPTAAKPAELHVPSWTKTTLSNGAELIVSERHTLPLVSFRINFIGGANQFEPANESGLATVVASMMSEGTTHRTGDQLSNDLQMLGTSIGTSINGESGQITFQSTKDKFVPTLAILGDVLLNPTFPQDALDRLRNRLIVNLTQLRDRTAAVEALAAMGETVVVGKVAQAPAMGAPFVEIAHQHGRRIALASGEVREERLGLAPSPQAGKVEMHADDP